jgi:hypothetical protein
LRGKGGGEEEEGEGCNSSHQIGKE